MGNSSRLSRQSDLGTVLRNCRVVFWAKSGEIEALKTGGATVLIEVKTMHLCDHQIFADLSDLEKADGLAPFPCASRPACLSLRTRRVSSEPCH